MWRKYSRCLSHSSRWLVSSCMWTVIPSVNRIFYNMNETINWSRCRSECIYLYTFRQHSSLASIKKTRCGAVAVICVRVWLCVTRARSHDQIDFSFAHPLASNIHLMKNEKWNSDKLAKLTPTHSKYMYFFFRVIYRKQHKHRKALLN